MAHVYFYIYLIITNKIRYWIAYCTVATHSEKLENICSKQEFQSIDLGISNITFISFQLCFYCVETQSQSICNFYLPPRSESSEFQGAYVVRPKALKKEKGE